MADLLSLVPGCLVAWFDWRDKPNFALVVAVKEHLSAKCYVATTLVDTRLRSLTLFKADMGGKWRVVSRCA